MLWVGLAATPALAQSPSGPAVTSESGGVRPAEIERGLYFGLAGGANFVFSPPADPGGVHPSSAGTQVELEIGGDLSPYFALSAFVRASQQREDGSYTGQSKGAAAGDFTMIVPGASFRVKPLSFQDSQGVKRTWVYLRGGAGYVLFYPKALLPNSDILVFVGPGIEYYTRLRHFSIGVEAVGSYLAKAGSFGFAVTPNLRYAF